MVVGPTLRQGVTPAPLSAAPDSDHLSIRDVRLSWADLVNRSLFHEDVVRDLRQRLQTARPYEHLVVENWFNPTLLELVQEEFDLCGDGGWRQVQNPHERTRRSVPHARFGPATQLYFAIVNSGWFVDLLGAVSGVQNLIPDPLLHGGGMHETRAGGGFGIHRDFERHVRLGLSNRMVFITYLNKDWDPAWDGALELWEGEHSGCITAVEPEFGRSILLTHGPRSYHGHPRPLKVPDGRPRRSVASYYYTNSTAGAMEDDQRSSRFLFPNRSEGLKRVAKLLTPPIVWMGLKRLTGRDTG